MVEEFIARWSGGEGGQERANYALFLLELCDVVGASRPDPASAATETNDYVFERAVKETWRDGTVSTQRIDLYKRGCFVLEAKQSRQRGGAKEIEGVVETSAAQRGRRGGERAWDVLMMNARRQAEDYVRLLPADHPAPPFVIVCDIGHCLELYANFRGDGRAYDQFPDRQGFRIYLEDLRKPDIRARLAAVFDPARVHDLDPTRRSAAVTREIAARLATVSKALEAAGHPPKDVAAFLARTLFTMFAEDVDLLPKKSFRDVLARCEKAPDKLGPLLTQLWEAMDTGGFALAIEEKVRRFNGEFFKHRDVLPLGRAEIAELRAAADANWREVEPAIFGTLLEQALDADERRRLGAHYTPRAYVERLVAATVIDPLRAEWVRAQAEIELAKSEIARFGPRDPRVDQVRRAARKVATDFHARLCATRVLDPACGTGNFLYVALEMMKRLEGEVIEAVEALEGQERFDWLSAGSVDPHQFLGLELNPRAAAIAELVLWIGHLQWHFRTKGAPPPEPILKAFKNIQVMDAVLKAETRLARDAAGKPLTRPGPEGAPLEVLEYRNPRRADWPAAEFIVGNPPFVGGKDIRARMGDAYAEALWAAHPAMNAGADFVMYWWDRAAELLTAKGTALRRFGFVTTNSITQVFQRRAVERHLKAKHPVSLVMAVPDHPWTKATADSAAVRIAMTVAEAGSAEGVLREVTREAALDTDTPVIETAERTGAINSDLTVGVDVAGAVPLKANEGLASRGVALHGAGFIVTPEEAARLGLGRRPGLEAHIRPYRNGRDLTARPRGVMVIDLFGLGVDEVRARFPEVYQHVLTHVKPEREAQLARSSTADAKAYATTWWQFGKPRPELRQAIAENDRYIATVETTKHRVFLFLESKIRPDNKLIAIGSEDAFFLGVLSARVHHCWYLRSAGMLGVYEREAVYVKSRCFDPFPFPLPTDTQAARVRAIAEDLDALRKDVLAAHAHLTLTKLYNVLERLRAGAEPDALSADERRVFDDGLVAVLKEHHDALDLAVAEAYGWPADLSDEDVLARLVALNRERAAEERRGLVRWLRPDYQIAKFGDAKERAEQIEATLVAAEASSAKPSYPADESGQIAMVMAALAASARPLDAAGVAATFRQGRRVEPKVAAVLGALTRMGAIAADRGRFALRRAA